MDWYFIFLAVVPSFSFFLPFSFLSPPSPLPPSFSVVLTKSHSLHVLRHNDRAFCLSAEISQWFWDSDLLQSMLRQVHLLVAVVSTHTGTPPSGCGIHTHTWVQTCVHICPLIPSPLTCSQVQKPVWGLLVQERRAPQLFQCLKRTPASRFVRYQREVTVYALDE